MRTKPFTDIGVRRLKCIRCGAQATAQWNACADGEYRPICEDCDVKLNALVLAWMKIPNAARKIKAYIKGKVT